MKRRHVPGPLVLTEADVIAAEALLDETFPHLHGGALGIDMSTSWMIRSLLRADLELLTPAVLGTERHRVSTVGQLAARGHVSRSSIYSASSLAPSMARCALALVTLLAARGDFGDATVWRACDLSSPVGRGANGPGIVGGRQQLFGISLAGGDVDVPAILATPTANLDKAGLRSELEQMVGAVLHVADEVRAYAESELLGLDAQRGLAVRPALLAPQLNVGTPVLGWLYPIALGDTNLAQVAVRNGFASAVVEIEATPYGQHGWRRIEPDRLARLLGLVGSVDLDISIQPSAVTYWVREAVEGKSGALHRRQHSTGHEAGTAVAGDLNYVVEGLDLRNNQELARALAYVELLASGRGQRFVQTFGEQLAPTLVKASSPELRSMYRSMRMILNAALVSVGRSRQAALLTQELTPGAIMLPATLTADPITLDTRHGPVRVTNLGPRSVWIEVRGDLVLVSQGPGGAEKVVARFDDETGELINAGGSHSVMVER